MASREGRWMPSDKLRALVELGWKNTDIARANEDVTGYRPSPSTVTKKLQRIGIPPRKASHKELIWWTIRPEHSHDPIYYGLQALSRERQGVKLSKQDRARAKVLTDLLTQRGGPFVVDYDPERYPERGFVIVPKIDRDTDIVRRPEPPDASQTGEESNETE